MKSPPLFLVRFYSIKTKINSFLTIKDKHINHTRNLVT